MAQESGHTIVLVDQAREDHDRQRHFLDRLSGIRQGLASVRRLDELKLIHDAVVAAQAYARAHRLGMDAQNDCAELIVMAAYRMGQFLRAMEKRQGARIPKEQRGADSAPRLADLGIGKHQSADFQLLASVTEDRIYDFFARKRHTGHLIRISELLRTIVRKRHLLEAQKMAARRKWDALKRENRMLYGMLDRIRAALEDCEKHDFLEHDVCHDRLFEILDEPWRAENARRAKSWLQTRRRGGSIR